MWFVLLFNLCLGLSYADINPYHYCADLNTQPHVDVDSLMGLWYGIEIISHKIEYDSEKDDDDDEEGLCPIIHISKEENDTYYEKNYESVYGADYGYRGGYQDSTQPHESNVGVHQHHQFNTDTNRGFTRYNVNNKKKNKPTENLKRLKLLISDNGRFVSYYLRYNETKAGFWISSGPNNGSYLERRFNHFAGTIQVLKAVANHLVLVFCHQLPEKKLYTLIVSRVPNLSQHEIHGIHNLLTRRELTITHVTKVCSGSGTNGFVKINSFLISIISFLYLYLY